MFWLHLSLFTGHMWKPWSSADGTSGSYWKGSLGGSTQLEEVHQWSVPLKISWDSSLFLFASQQSHCVPPTVCLPMCAPHCDAQAQRDWPWTETSQTKTKLFSFCLSWMFCFSDRKLMDIVRKDTKGCLASCLPPPMKCTATGMTMNKRHRRPRDGEVGAAANPSYTPKWD